MIDSLPARRFPLRIPNTPASAKAVQTVSNIELFQKITALQARVQQLEQALSLTGQVITLKSGSASIVLKPDGTIDIKGKDITLQGTGKVNVKATGELTLKGSKIAQN